MNLRPYRYELIVGISFFLMLIAFFYKNAQVSSQAEQLFTMKQEVRDFKEIIALKRVWGDKGLSKKIDRLQSIVPVSKVTWNKKGKKLTARYKELTSKELNKLMTKVMSLAVQIIELDISKSGENYNVECKCKW
ncbi:hypothetical protein [Sulfurovum sp. NBC37-1]|uniref:hypothetical protein n=1 Tax=Sulfurovum sp. (strain NBC37-1) TaxID=387093 RepID=UPI0001587702|nr:hypothetical protein [Sulfurovum sp. NBC37-1]BAF70988.1 hypothetical protein SUN_0027 [Sulfurovum sp. NBC37-1]